MDIPWMRRWEDKPVREDEKPEIANMDRDDFTILLEEIEHH